MGFAPGSTSEQGGFYLRTGFGPRLPSERVGRSLREFDGMKRAFTRYITAHTTDRTCITHGDRANVQNHTTRKTLTNVFRYTFVNTSFF